MNFDTMITVIRNHNFTECNIGNLGKSLRSFHIKREQYSSIFFFFDGSTRKVGYGQMQFTVFGDIRADCGILR